MGEELTIANYTSQSIFDVKFADMMGNGNLDMIVAFASSPQIVIYLNPGGSNLYNSPSPWTAIPLPGADVKGSIWGFDIADLNGDGRPDIIYGTNIGGVANLNVLENTYDNTSSIPFYNATINPNNMHTIATFSMNLAGPLTVGEF